MGTLKMLHMKQCKGKNKARHLENALNYIFNPEKFSERWMGGNVGSSSKEVFDSMMRLKKVLGKEDGRQGYHFILTFLPGEVDENLACSITEEFCELYLKDQYQYTFVAHNDKPHMHTHIVFNSIDMNGMKYHYADGDWAKKIQPIVNKLCRKYGLSEINLKKEDDKKVIGDKSNKKTNAKNNNGKKAARNSNTENQKTKSQGKKMKWRDLRKDLYKQTKMDINIAIQESESLDQFYIVMEKMKYKIRHGKSKDKGSYVTFRQEGKKGVRDYTLGAGYKIEDIQYQIENKDKIFLSDTSFQSDAWVGKYKSVYYHTTKNLRQLYWKNTYLLRNWKGERLSLYPQMNKYRKSLEKLQQIEEENRYIVEMDVNDISEVEEKIYYVEYKLKELGKLRYEIVASVNAAGEHEDGEINEELIQITSKYKRYMKEKQILERIKKKEQQMQKDEEEIQKENRGLERKMGDSLNKKNS